MGSPGKLIRWKRFLNRNGEIGIIVPIDHGFTRGPIQGIENIKNICSWLTHPIISGILAHKGMIAHLATEGCLINKGVMVHLNGMISTSIHVAKKIQLTGVEHAIRWGADAVSLDLNFDGLNDAQNVQLLGQVVDAADQYGLPVLVMVSDKIPIKSESNYIERLRHFIRLSMELGADAVKVAFELGPKNLKNLLHLIALDIPIFLAGGGLQNDDNLILEYFKEAMECGAKGMCIGRNIFQRKNPTILLDKLEQLVQ
ncbi:class I fructose-bisphosphate aldolase [Candidatus Protochlamydia sp. W-9]|uniref:class I fructose-bisphosphate aldolase n=1 Tax=Candidatus Protochlamydia sp. W-9 TaxID=1785087 RepID=UPI00096ABF7C|nr:hypothetical protein [Candidatus Protochlamydia sp. W-9]